jgi:hypothetical protein
MQLTEYPTAIAQSSRELLKSEQAVKEAKRYLDCLTAQYDREIAFNPELKNDAQRKAARIELMESSEYLTASETFDAEELAYKSMQVASNFLLNSFSVAKLERRGAIASTEFQAACAA